MRDQLLPADDEAADGGGGGGEANTEAEAEAEGEAAAHRKSDAGVVAETARKKAPPPRAVRKRRRSVWIWRPDAA